MGGVFVLVGVAVALYVIVLVGAVAYELTGLDRETAMFQALSAFTGTGFTTRASELVVGHPMRRRITVALIVLGYAGTASVVAGVFSSFAMGSLGLSLRNLAVLVVVGGAVLAGLRRAGRGISDLARRFLTARVAGESVPHEELLLYHSGFGITRIEIPPASRVAGQRLRDTDLRERRLQVLAVEDGDAVIAVPKPELLLDVGQHLVIYGDLAAVQAAFGPDGVEASG